MHMMNLTVDTITESHLCVISCVSHVVTRTCMSSIDWCWWRLCRVNCSWTVPEMKDLSWWTLRKVHSTSNQPSSTILVAMSTTQGDCEDKDKSLDLLELNSIMNYITLTNLQVILLNLDCEHIACKPVLMTSQFTLHLILWAHEPGWPLIMLLYCAILTEYSLHA